MAGRDSKAACMIAWTDYQAGEHRIECPSCGRGGRDKTAGLTIEYGGEAVPPSLMAESGDLFETSHP